MKKNASLNQGASAVGQASSNITWTAPAPASGATVTVGVAGNAANSWIVPTTVYPAIMPGQTVTGGNSGGYVGGNGWAYPCGAGGYANGNAAAQRQWQQQYEDLIDAWKYTGLSEPAWVDGPELFVGDLIELTLDQHVVALMNMLHKTTIPQSRDNICCHALVIPAAFGSAAMCPCREQSGAHYHITYIDGLFEHTRSVIVLGNALHGTVKVVSRGA